MVNELIWKHVSTSGTSLRTTDVDFNRDVLSVIGAAGLDPNGYVDDEKGYDGWELHGTFNGEVFNIYTRFGSMRIGGYPTLDVDGLVAALKEIVK